MKKFILFAICILFTSIILRNNVLAENIHFGEYLYKHRTQNQYYKEGETPESWISKIEVYHYPEISNPLKYAQEKDREIESDEKCVLLKFIQSKKQNIAIISYLENGVELGGNYFAYNIYKYQKDTKKGIVALRYVKKYMFNSNDEIAKIGQEIRQINNDYMERMIITEIPEKKDTNLTEKK
ncbi:MAG: hypothetical protein NC191_03300 [Muribaculaceae bacterium]|nr:hypothetical protein [Muribaculaceae bacterium]